MTEARIAFQQGTMPAGTSFPWASTSSGAADLPLSNVSGTGWNYRRVSVGANPNQATVGPSSVSPPASTWVDEIVIAEQSMWTSADVRHEWTLLDDSKTYAFELFGARLDSGSTRRLDVSLSPTFETFETLETNANTSQTILLTGLAPNTGGLVIYTRQNGASASVPHVSAVRLYEEEVSAPGPTLTNINTTNEVVPGTTATVTGTNLTGATGFNIDAEAQSAFTVVSDTSITFTTVRGGNPYNQNLTGTLLHPDGNATITVQQVPESGTFAVTAANPNTTDAASLWAGLVDTVTGNPVAVENGSQFWVNSPIPGLAIDPDGTITANETGTFTGQFWLASEGVWGDDQTVSFELPGDNGGDPVDPQPPVIGIPSARGVGFRKSVRSALRSAAGSSIH